MRFSIITASFNSGEKLEKTIRNIAQQTCEDYEVIVKDGMSKDDCVELLKGSSDERVQRALASGQVKVICQADKSVYDGMNQALDYCSGDYVIFMNCGDYFHEETVLQKVSEQMDAYKEMGKGDNPVIFYGNTFCERTGAEVHSAPSINGFTCYRNIPCHQSCFYDRRLFAEKRYDLEMRIRADYDHFLWCFYVGKSAFQYMDLIVADYEGGGISESKANMARDKKEHQIITRRYMSGGELFRYKSIMALTLAPLRRWIAESSSLSGVYHKLKTMIYRK